jgi:LIM domain
MRLQLENVLCCVVCVVLCCCSAVFYMCYVAAALTVRVRSFFFLQHPVMYCTVMHCIVLLVRSLGTPMHLMMELVTFFSYITHTHTPQSSPSSPSTSSSFSLLPPPFLFAFIYSFFCSPLQRPYFLFTLTSISPSSSSSPSFSSLLYSPSPPPLLHPLLFSAYFSPSFSFPVSSSPSSSSLPGAAWHKACFKCGDGESLWGCSRGLTQDNYSQYGGWPFCKACYTKNFKQGESV